MRRTEQREWSIQEVARIAGTTSRTLRHYDAIGLLRPSRVGDNGYRFYDRDAVVRLQRILLLRELGLGLPAVAEVLDQERDVPGALRAHVGWLRAEQERIGRQITAVEHTLAALEDDGEELTMSTMFDGFDHTRYRDEVERRWGAQAYARSSAWWEAMTPDERARWQRDAQAMQDEWVALAGSGADPYAEDAQRLAARHVAWLTSVPGTPAADGDASALRAYVVGLAGMYVADPRFAAHYGGETGAAFVRSALERYADTTL